MLRTSTQTSKSEPPGTKLLCTFFKVRLKNDFKASLQPVDVVAPCDMRFDGGPEEGRAGGGGGGWGRLDHKKKETKVFKEKE